MRTFVLLGLLLAATLTLAKDIVGGKDHPLLSRFAGSQLDGYQEIKFGQGLFYLPSANVPAKELQMDKPLTVEGKVTRLLYLAPKGKTPLEVHRNFELALSGAGVDMKTSANGKGANWEPVKHWRDNFKELKFQNGWASDVSPFWRDGMYLYGEMKRAGQVWHISVLTAQNFSESNTPQAAVAVQIVEPAAMATGQVTVNADALKQGLSAEGKVALHGLYFDTGKAELKPESKAQLEQMALVLRQNAAWRVFIVGHTDNQGQFDANLALSQRRAEAVVEGLTKDHQIDRKRLLARGVANISPVASNGGEADRAKNRRVEMVEQ
jgi:OOP family OmpA-OmpF porin